MTAAVGPRSPAAGKRRARDRDAGQGGGQPHAHLDHDGDRLSLSLTGPWVLETARRIEQEAAGIREPLRGFSEIVVDLGEVTALDTTGAWLIKRRIDHLAAGGAKVGFRNTSKDRLELLKSVAACPADTEVDRPRPNLAIELADRTGRATLQFLAEVTRLLGFFGLIVTRMVALARHPSRLRLTSVQFHMEATGLNAIPIVALLAFLVGVVIAYQGAIQLRQFGAEVFTIDLLGFSILREMGVLLTAIIVAGRSGSAFAAQIGTMKVNEEVDAMRTMGLDTVDYLVIPRILALVITLPLLVFMANLVALVGGAFVSAIALDIDFGTFLRRLRSSVDVVQLFVGLVKAPVFAFVIAMVGCYEGLKVSGSAQSVGERTTTAVVESIFLVIVLDAGFSILFAFLDI